MMEEKNREDGAPPAGEKTSRPTADATSAPGSGSSSGSEDTETAPESSPASGDAPPPGEEIDVELTRANMESVLKSVYDPEIPANIYDMGMIYEFDVTPSGEAYVKMTLTSPACPVAGSLPGEVETKILGIPEIRSARVDLVWDPPWNPNMMNEVARLQTGMF